MHAAAVELDEEEHVQPLQPDRLEVKKSTASMLCAWARRNSRQPESRARAGGPETRLLEELADGRGRDRNAEAVKLTGDPLIPPARVLTREPQHQRTDLAADRRPTNPARRGPASRHQPPVPATSLA